MEHFFRKDVPLKYQPMNESDIQPWKRYHSFHLRDPLQYPSIYFVLALLFLCGGEKEDYFYLTEGVYQQFRNHPEYQLRLARYICPFYKCHTWELLFVPWSRRRFTQFVRHLIGKYYVPLYDLSKSDAHCIHKRQILLPTQYTDYLPHFISSDPPPLPEMPPDSVGRPPSQKMKKTEPGTASDE